VVDKSGPVIDLTERDLEIIARHLGDRLAAHAFRAHYEDDQSA